MSITMVQTSKGKIQGLQRDGHSAFWGIPFAKPPIEERRFRRPEPVQEWTGVFKADHFGNRCIQPGQQAGSFYGKEFWSDPNYLASESEDCLYLNVWTPAADAGEKLPVAMYIHGGAFVNGSGTNINFDGEAMAKKGVILVTVNYRLNVFGYLAHEWFFKEDPDGSVGNYAFWDHLAALAWIRENIAAFGGDPQKITIFGQSAGSMSVQQLCRSEHTRGKIAGAVMQSGLLPMGRSFERTAKDAMAQGAAFVESLGIKSKEELRAYPARELFRAAMAALKQFGPCIDGAALRSAFAGSFEQGLYHDISYMLGSTKNDFFIPREAVEQGQKPGIYDEVIRAASALNARNRHRAYAYWFAHDLPGDEAGAFHSSELWYMFGTLGRSWRPNTAQDYALSERMVTVWTDFFKAGNPGWPPCLDGKAYVQALQ